MQYTAGSNNAIRYSSAALLVSLLLIQACSSKDALPTTAPILEDGPVNVNDNPINDDPTVQPMMTLANYQSVVANVFSYVNGRYPVGSIDKYQTIFNDTAVLLEDFPASPAMSSLGSREVFACQNGGTLDASSVAIPYTGNDYIFDNCLVPSLDSVHQGGLSRQVSKYETKWVYDNLQVFSADGVLKASAAGFLQEIRPNTPFCGTEPTMLRQYDDLYLSFLEGNHTLNDTEISYHISDPVDGNQECSSRVEAAFTFTVEASESSGQNYSVVVSTPTPLFGAGKTITEGQMLITATDGSFIELNVLEDGSDMINIKVSNAERVDEIVEPKSYLMDQLTAITTN